MQKVRFYRVSQRARQPVTTTLINYNKATFYYQMNKVIAIKGRTPGVGYRVRIRKYPSGKKQWAWISRVSPTGIPIQAELEDGQVIELVGYLIQLIHLLDAISIRVKMIFQQLKTKKLRTAL